MGYPGMGSDGDSGGSGSGSGRTRSRVTKKDLPTLEKKQSISYDVTTSDQIFSISSAVHGETKESIPSIVEIENDGDVPVMLMTGYETYSDETTDGATEYLHTMLMPGEVFDPPVRAVIGTASAILDGTALSNTVPDSNMYRDSGTTLGEDVDDSETDFDVADGDYFRVGDLIQLGINETLATRIEIMEITAISTNNLTVTRGLYGTTAADKDNQDNATSGAVSGAKVYLPIRNAYHDYDKYTVPQTDSNGKFKCNSFFGYGRAASAVQGIIPGSVAIKFYESGYQSLGLSGITSSTDSALTASGSYWFKIAIDGGTAESINFTVDSSNTNFGGTNGIITKIQDALNDKYKNTASNTFEQKSTVGIVNGDLRFTSGTHLEASAIDLSAGVDGASASYNIFAQQNGRFPALANIRSAIAARLPDDVIYNRITFTTSPNAGVFLYDDGFGGLLGNGSGTINYETGAIDMKGCPVNAEFVVSVLHTSVFAGKLNEATGDRINSLVDIYANTPSQKWNGSVKIRTF